MLQNMPEWLLVLDAACHNLRCEHGYYRDSFFKSTAVETQSACVIGVEGSPVGWLSFAADGCNSCLPPATALAVGSVVLCCIVKTHSRCVWACGAV